MNRRTDPLGRLSLERHLVERSWTDPAFAERLRMDAHQALADLGVEISPDVKIDVRLQRRDTLYLVIPPPAASAGDAQSPVNQMDLWQSAELFCWILPEALKLELLRIRQSFRRAHS